MRTYLEELINRMCDRNLEKTSSETIAYNAYREVDNIKDENLLPTLFEIVNNELDENKRNKAYYIISKIALPNNDIESLNFFLQKLKKEKSKGIIEDLLKIISSFKKPKEIDLANIFNFLNNKSNLIRHNAILALENCNSTECENKLIMILENSTNQHDLLYSVQVLSTSGFHKSLPKLKELITHSKQDISNSALWGIYQIAKEKELPLYLEQLKKSKNKFTALQAVVMYGNDEVIPNIIKRIKELISKKRNIEVIGEYGYTELIIAMNFLIKFHDSKVIKDIYSLLEIKKDDFLWEIEKEWLINNPIDKGSH